MLANSAALPPLLFMWCTSRGNKFPSNSRVHEYCDQKGLSRPRELLQAFRQTKHAAASCTSSPSPLPRPCLSPQYLGSAEPVSWCDQGRLLCGGFPGARGHEVSDISPLTALQHMTKSPQLLAGWGLCVWEAFASILGTTRTWPGPQQLCLEAAEILCWRKGAIFQSY